MITKCPHCKKDLNLPPANRAKLESALAANKGKSLKFPCPHCKKPIEVSAETNAAPKPAPAKSGNEKPVGAKSPAAGNKPPEEKPQPEAETAEVKKKKADFPKPINPPPPAPEAPDITWLMSGKMEEKKIIEDIPTAMILIPAGEIRDKVAEVMKKLDYQLYFPKNSEEAIGKMRFKDFAAAAYHFSYEGKPLAESEFHSHLSHLAMVKRRYMFYLLIGPNFHTLYDLEALAYSANLVVNEKEIAYLSMIMAKAKNDYDVLFGPFINTLKAHGKR